MIAEIWFRCPVARVRRGIWWAAGWVCGKEGEDFGVGEGGRLGVDDLF